MTRKSFTFLLILAALFAKQTLAADFYAYYTHLKTSEAFEKYSRTGDFADVIVVAGTNKLVFWRGTSYLPYLENTKGKWPVDEIIPRRGDGTALMPDATNMFSHASIISANADSIVVLWRYLPLFEMNKYSHFPVDASQTQFAEELFTIRPDRKVSRRIRKPQERIDDWNRNLNLQANYDSISNWGDWSDWLYYIYPDGLAVKHMRLYTSGKLNHEWQEGMAIIGENSRPEDVIEQSPVYYYINDSGKVSQYDWKDAFTQKIDYASQRIFVANFKSDWDPFTICDFTGGDIYNNKEYRPYSVFCNWNHWPASLIRSDGRFTGFPDRASHSSLNHIFWNLYRTHTGDVPWYEKVMMEGMSNQKAVDLYMLSCSWMNPPLVTKISGADSVVYLQTERAFQIKAKSTAIRFSILAHEKQPLINPCFVVENWNSDQGCQFFCDGILLSEGKNFRQGIVRNTQGRQTLVIWLKNKSMETTEIEILRK